MTKVPQFSQKSSVNLTTAATAYFLPVGNSSFLLSTTEANDQVIYRTAGVLSNLAIYLVSNNRGASTAKSRINGADGAQTISIGASGTGYFEDVTNTDTLTAGDAVCMQYTTGAAGSASAPGNIGTHFAATTNTALRLVGRNLVNLTTASATRWHPLAGLLQSSTTESFHQAEYNTAGTLKNFYVYVSANARTTTTTFRSRKNTANGNLVISVGSGATGAFEDTSNTDTIAVNDIVNAQSVTGTGTETLALQVVSAEFVTTDNSWTQIVGSLLTVNPALTRYMGFGGEPNQSATEINTQSKMRVAFDWSNMWLRLSANTLDGASTLTGRLNTADTLMTVSIATATSGTFEDTTNIIAVAIADVIDYQLITGGATGTVSLRLISSKSIVPSIGGVLKDIIGMGVVPFVR